MTKREENIKLLQDQGFGLEEMENGYIDVYTDKFYFDAQLRTDEQLQEYVNKNAKK